MEPMSAAIIAAAQLIGGLLGSHASSEAAKRQQAQQALGTEFGMQQQAARQAQETQQGAFSNLIEAYRSSLLG